jgi:triosephosphate isomerase
MASRTPIVGGNWKMNTDLAGAVELADTIVARCDELMDRCEVVLFPPFPYLQAVGRTMGHHAVALGAQNVYHEPAGAFTGEVSVAMLVDLGVSHVLVGHSERRHVLGEEDELISRKLRAALAGGLRVVLCVGETIEQREAGRTEAITVGQVVAGLAGVPAEQITRVIIAYEPVWAIGTGRTASPEDAQSVHGLIRRTVAERYDETSADSIRIQYGGSVKASNARDLFSQPDVDGGLVGGASLDGDQFAQIIEAAVDAKGSRQGVTS